jgi:Cation transporting ATPase, C-terminus
MCLEPPESGLLSRPPRNVKTERLANSRLLLQAYGFLGIIESLCAMAMLVSPHSRIFYSQDFDLFLDLVRSFWYLQRHGVPFSSLALKFGNYPAALTNDLLYEAQSVYFFTLVVMQWGCVNFLLSGGTSKLNYHVFCCTQQPAFYSHAAIEHLPATADVGRQSCCDTRRFLCTAHRHLLLLRACLVRLCLWACYRFAEPDL